MSGTTRFNLGYLLFALLGVLLLHDVWSRASETKAIAYSELKTLLEEGKVAEVVVLSDRVVGKLKEPDGRTVNVATAKVDPKIAEELDRYGVKYSARIESTLLPTLLSWIVPVLLFFGVWLLIAKRMASKLGGPGGGLLSIGKSKAKVYVETEVKTRFADVAGVDEAKAELAETVSFLRDPKSHGRLGARMPKGILLVGPPGTGKTLLARAVAGEASVPFFSISGSEFVEMFVGVGAARVRDLFEQARQKAPCIIFIDELDALGRARASSMGMGGHDEKEQTLNQLLVELDGFDPTSGIVLLGATNRPEVLDAALLRAGRFDRQVVVDRPDKHGRAAILRVHLQKVKHGEDVSPEAVAALTPGFTGAELANVVNEAALAATRRDAEAVASVDFTHAIERIVAGAEKKTRLLGPRERSIVAHHEMGHALVAAALPATDRVHKVSIVPRGLGALGYTLQRPSDDRYLLTKDELEQKLAVLLGGRVAEELVFGHLSTGASDDLARTTDLARDMVTRYGMVPELGHVTYGGARGRFLGGPAGFGGEERPHSETTAREIDQAVRAIVDRAYARARAVLVANQPLLLESSAQLLTEETLDEAQLAPLFARLEAVPDAPRPVPLPSAA